LRTKIVFHALK